MSHQTCKMSVGFIAVVALVAGVVLALAGPAWAGTITWTDTATWSPSVGIFNLESKTGNDSLATGTTNVSYNYGTDTYTVISKSSNLSDSDNSNAHRLYKQFTGDFVLTAQIDGTGGFGNAKSGFFAADSNVTNSNWKEFRMLYMPERDSGRFEAYGISGGGSVYTSGTPTGLGHPMYVKLERSGTTMTGSYSTAGTIWTSLGSRDFGTLSSTLYVGLLGNSNEEGWPAGVMTYKFMSLTPEPTTMALLALGGVGMLVRRRRR